MNIIGSGITNVGGDRNIIFGNDIRADTTVHAGREGSAERRPDRTGDTWHVGIVTVLPEENGAVREVLSLTDDGSAGQRYYTGRLETTNLVATQTSGDGQLPIMAALTNLRDRYDPTVLALVGIGGGIHSKILLNDVVIATRVVCYEKRKLLPRQTLRRGQEFQAPSVITHSVNAFFAASGDPATLPGQGASAPFRVHSGLIGTGEAVIANAEDENRSFLTGYNDKVMAVEMEAGGLAQFCHDTTTRSGVPRGWVIVRGISDLADIRKDDDYHNTAAVNSAQTVRHLIPYLRPQL